MNKIEKKNQYLKNKRETDVKFRLSSNKRSRIYKPLKGMIKQSSIKKSIRNTYRNLSKLDSIPIYTRDKLV